jgi:hypothetical protein
MILPNWRDREMELLTGLFTTMLYHGSVGSSSKCFQYTHLWFRGIIYPFIYLLAVLGFEVRALSLVGRYSTT